MRASEFIIESTELDPKVVAKTLRMNCAPYFRANDFYADSPLFRGSYDMDMTSLKAFSIRADRLPRDTRLTIHKAAGQWFKEKFGIDYRANATFATGGSGTASAYGDVCLLFPIGQFSYCWSPKVKDFTYGFIDTRYFGDDGDIAVELSELLEWAQYRVNDGLHRAIDSYNEIMIHASGYYLVKDQPDGDKEFGQKVLAALEDMQ